MLSMRDPDSLEMAPRIKEICWNLRGRERCSLALQPCPRYFALQRLLQYQRRINVIQNEFATFFDWEMLGDHPVQVPPHNGRRWPHVAGTRWGWHPSPFRRRCRSIRSEPPHGSPQPLAALVDICCFVPVPNGQSLDQILVKPISQRQMVMEHMSNYKSTRKKHPKYPKNLWLQPGKKCARSNLWEPPETNSID